VLQVLLWDVDGTLAETERDGHRVAFNQSFESLGVPWRWSEAYYGELLLVAGGRERLLHDMQRQSGAPSDESARQALAERLHRLKNEHYARLVREGRLPLRPGVAELMSDCERAGLRMGIATTTSGSNVAALLEQHLGSKWRSRFVAVVCAEEAPKKKPDPQVYQMALASLQLSAHEAVAIEDSPAGMQAALSAGLPVVVTHSGYFPGFRTDAALAAGPSLGQSEGWRPRAEARATRIDLAQITEWFARSPRAQ
jgi:HAD superfamily hydrolase (TIGR01509 family)